MSLTSVLKKFITGFSSASSSSGFGLSASGASSSFCSGSTVTLTGSVNVTDSCFRLVASYTPSQRISLLRIMPEQRSWYASGVLIAPLRWEPNSNHASAYSANCQQSAFYQCECPTPHSLIFNNVTELCPEKCQKHQIPCCPEAEHLLKYRNDQPRVDFGDLVYQYLSIFFIQHRELLCQKNNEWKTFSSV